MSVSVSRRTWEEASSPAAVQFARKYEQAWREASEARGRPALRDYLREAESTLDGAATRLAILRADLALRFEAGEPISARWYMCEYKDLGEDTIVALIYEEFCLREENHDPADPADFVGRYPEVADSLSRILEIHDLVGSGTGVMSFTASTGGAAPGGGDRGFPRVGETIGGFRLVEELGRGSFARVFLALEQDLADRPVALKVTRRGSREPQTLARLQHTHIVPVHSYRIDATTGLHLLCMPFFGRITLARLLSDPAVLQADSGRGLIEALDRLEGAGALAALRSAGRAALARRSYPRAIAWWGARLAEALDHAHDRGVLHRDIKPSNVLVTGDGMPMLLDFNLAHDPLIEDGGGTLGGTIDYMAPEHLMALAVGTSDPVDARADVYGLGVILHEALIGRRPFPPPPKGGSIVEALLRAVDLRKTPIPSLTAARPEIPPALSAVIRHALDPDPAARYQSASELALDLHAVSSDLPLVHAREPWPSRARSWLRRKRKKLLAYAGFFAGFLAVAALGLGYRLDRSENSKLVQQVLDDGETALKKRDFATAKLHFDNAGQLAARFEEGPFALAFRRRDPRAIGVNLWRMAVKLLDQRPGTDFEELKEQALEQALIAARHDQAQRDARAVLAAADVLRFRLLLGEGRDLTGAVADLKKVLYPFRVLELEDWTADDGQGLRPLTMLSDEALRDRLRTEIDQLLFLWMTAVDEALAAPGPDKVKVKESELASALAICDRATASSRSKGPWHALRACMIAHASHAPMDRATADRLVDEPADVASVSSSLACFEWGLLSSREDRKARAIDWVKRAVRIQLDDYWYEFFLGYLEDKAGRLDDALGHYSVAVGLKPTSPNVRFNRARLYRAKGQWEAAVDDMEAALERFGDRPEADLVRLELGYLHQEQGDFQAAREHYAPLKKLDPGSELARAARLNEANMDAETGRLERARAAYDDLVALEPRDAHARFSRALVALRSGEARQAEIDLTTLLDLGLSLPNRVEIVSTRALARLKSGRVGLALADAELAQKMHPSPARERLRERALLAARRFDQLVLESPGEARSLPLGGASLTTDLRAAAVSLAGIAQGTGDVALAASLNLAVVSAALGRLPQALAAADHALVLSPSSARALLIRSRVRAAFGDSKGAWLDVARGLLIEPSDPGLIEQRGILRAGAGQHRLALEDFDSAIFHGALDHAHFHKAQSLAALGATQSAVAEYSRALMRDPEEPRAYLGRSRMLMRQGRWDSALADLELAASWSHSDPWLEIEVVLAHARCLPHRPDRRPRWLSLAQRATLDVWRALQNH